MVGADGASWARGFCERARGPLGHTLPPGSLPEPPSTDPSEGRLLAAHSPGRGSARSAASRSDGPSLLWGLQDHPRPRSAGSPGEQHGVGRVAASGARGRRRSCPRPHANLCSRCGGRAVPPQPGRKFIRALRPPAPWTTRGYVLQRAWTPVRAPGQRAVARPAQGVRVSLPTASPRGAVSRAPGGDQGGSSVPGWIFRAQFSCHCALRSQLHAAPHLRLHGVFRDTVGVSPCPRDRVCSRGTCCTLTAGPPSSFLPAASRGPSAGSD